ncbi:MAG TPA: cobalamin biosynthesis protein [Actinomycetota bacterium]|nr:cobalamin biosynthesis protein [Actinomycetota bacterium]
MERLLAVTAAGRRRAGWPLAAGVLAGALADRVAGDPARWHPVAGFGALAGALEARCWRPSRLAGAAHVALLVGGSAAAAAAADRRLRTHPVARVAFTAAVTWAALGGRSLGRAATALADAVGAGDLEAGRRLAPSLVGRDPSGLDGPELCRAAVESVAENTADAVVGPLVWAVLAGPAGVVAYRAANTLDAMVGHQSPRYRRFGWAAARLDDVLTWPAARLGAAMAAVLAPAVGGDPGGAWRTLRRDGTAHPSPNAGRLEAAFAGALRVRLGGRNRYGERVEDRPPLGDGPPPGPAAVARAARLSALVGGTAAVLAALTALGLGLAREARPAAGVPR